MSLEDDVKSWLTSKTIWGGLIATGASVAGAVFKIEFPQDFVVEVSTQIAAVFGGLLAIYGRAKAVKKIK